MNSPGQVALLHIDDDTNPDAQQKARDDRLELRTGAYNAFRWVGIIVNMNSPAGARYVSTRRVTIFQ